MEQVLFLLTEIGYNYRKLSLNVYKLNNNSLLIPYSYIWFSDKSKDVVIKLNDNSIINIKQSELVKLLNKNLRYSKINNLKDLDYKKNRCFL